MALVDPDCFKGLSPQEQLQQLFEALSDIVAGGGGGGGGAPDNATYITQTPNASLGNEQALSALATGVMFVTTGTGAVTSQNWLNQAVLTTSDVQFDDLALTGDISVDGTISGNGALITGLPIAGIDGLGAGVATWLATPSSANLAAAVTGETGSDALVFGTSPTFTTSIVAGSATMAVFNTVATTVNAFGAATTLNIGSAATTINGGGIAAIVYHTAGTYTTYPASADSDAARGTAIQNARTAAVSGETIWVNTGGHTVTSNLAKAGVNWHFAEGSSVTWTAAASGSALFGDGGAAMTFTVGGLGDFSITTSSGPAYGVRSSNASSNITFNCRDVTATGDGTGAAVYGDAGRLHVHARRIIGGTGGSGAWWNNGDFHVVADEIISDSGYALYATPSAAPTADGYVLANNISGAYGVQMFGNQAAAAFWITCNTMRGSGITYAIRQTGSGRLYVTAQKIFANIELSDGLLYVEADKISATGAVPFLEVTGGIGRISIGEFDVNGFAANFATVSNASTLSIIGADFIGGASSQGLFTGGDVTTINLLNCYINTVANSTTTPINIDLSSTTATVSIRNSTLVAEGAAESISAPSDAVNIRCYASYANMATGGGVTNLITGGLTVDSDVQ